MIRLDREGIFKAKPRAWSVRTSANSQSVGVNLEFVVLEQLGDDGSWVSWADADPHNVYGTFYVVKKDGKVNPTGVEQLVAALGWNGDLRSIVGAPPDVVVQITVKNEPYNGTDQFKATWMNPGDFVPGPGGASEGDVVKLQARFGSLLKAAAAGAAKGAAKPAAAKSAASPAPASSSRTAAATKVRREDRIAFLTDPDKWSITQSEAAGMGLHLEATKGLEALADDVVTKLYEQVFDAAVPF